MQSLNMMVETTTSQSILQPFSISTNNTALSSDHINILKKLNSTTDTSSLLWIYDILSNLPPSNNTVNFSQLVPRLIESKSPHEELAVYEFPTELVVLVFILYGIITCVAVLGNLLVLLVVAFSRVLHSVTNYYIANLALADVIIGLFAIPFQFQAALLQQWKLPYFMCSFSPFVQTLSVNASIFTLTAIAVDRYRAICFPLTPKRSKFKSKLVIPFIWVVSALIAIPMAIAHQVKLIKVPPNIGPLTPQCLRVNLDLYLSSTYSHVLFIIQYLLPLSIITFAYVKISLKLWGSQIPGNAEDQRDARHLKMKKKVIKMLSIVVVMFAVCWLPLQTYYILVAILDNKIKGYKYINIIWFSFHWLAMSNSCVNPFIYAIYNDNFKREFRNKFHRCCGTATPSVRMDVSECERSRHSFRMTRSTSMNASLALRAQHTCNSSTRRHNVRRGTISFKKHFNRSNIGYRTTEATEENTPYHLEILNTEEVDSSADKQSSLPLFSEQEV